MRLSAIPGTRIPFANSIVHLHLILWGKSSVAFNSGADMNAGNLRARNRALLSVQRRTQRAFRRNGQPAMDAFHDRGGHIQIA
jgi:hypothetical protein